MVVWSRRGLRGWNVDSGEMRVVSRCVLWFFFFFFFKQKTAYEIKECDWSSDVCSSDLGGAGAETGGYPGFQRLHQPVHAPAGPAGTAGNGTDRKSVV